LDAVSHGRCNAGKAALAWFCQIVSHRPSMIGFDGCEPGFRNSDSTAPIFFDQFHRNPQILISGRPDNRFSRGSFRTSTNPSSRRRLSSTFVRFSWGGSRGSNILKHDYDTLTRLAETTGCGDEDRIQSSLAASRIPPSSPSAFQNAEVRVDSVNTHRKSQSRVPVASN
jgi:hypothetical protein